MIDLDHRLGPHQRRVDKVPPTMHHECPGCPVAEHIHLRRPRLNNEATVMSAFPKTCPAGKHRDLGQHHWQGLGRPIGSGGQSPQGQRQSPSAAPLIG
jgi:hypothetical protein